MSYNNLKEVRDEVEKHGDVLSLKVEELRVAYGAGRMGIHVATAISDELAGMGIGHWPADIPIYSYEWVRLYKLGSAVGKVMQAILDFGEDQDELLRQVATGEDAAIVRRIREIVCN